MNEGYKYKRSYKESLESLKLIKNLYLNYYVKKNERLFRTLHGNCGRDGTRVPNPKINLPTQANKRNQTPRIPLTLGGLRDQMATDTSESLGKGSRFQTKSTR